MYINIHNYEEYMLSYVDGELNTEEEGAFRQFMLQHPELQKELQWLRATKLPVEHEIIFGDKGALYKQERRPGGKVFRLRRYKWVSAAACAVLLAIVCFQLREQPVPAGRMAVQETTHSPVQPVEHAAAGPDTGSPGETSSVKQKENTTSREGNIHKALAAASTGPREESGATPGVRKNATAEPPVSGRGADEAAAGNTLPPLPELPSFPAGMRKAAVNGSVTEVVPAKKGLHGYETGGKQLADEVNGKETPGNHKIAYAASRVSLAKQDLDSTITRKLDDINRKTSGFINNIAKNGIKIGHITFSFNH